MMEIPWDLGEYFKESPIQRLDSHALRLLNPRKHFPVQKTIDRMGELSAQAQGLKRTLTTYDKVVESDEGQVLYIMWKKSPQHEQSSVIVGMLKIGYKCLYLLDNAMKTYKTTPLCVLDFYVHSSLQRQGNGHALFEHMIKCEGSSVERVAIDKPSDSLLQFINKFYSLRNPLWQTTNYVVYPSFFHYLQPCDELTNSRAQPLSSKTEALAHKEKEYKHISRMQDSVGNIMMTANDTPVRHLAAPNTPKGRKNTRDFGHQAIW